MKITIPAANLTTGTQGLNIANLSISQVVSAEQALPAVQQAEKTVMDNLTRFALFIPELKAVAQHDAVVTSVDLNGPVFVVAKKSNDR